MKIRVISNDDADMYCHKHHLDITNNELTDEQFMEIYEQAGGDWEFSSLEEFVNEFNEDSNKVPTSTYHYIRVFND